MKNFRDYDRCQQLLLAPDLADWVRDDDLAHFIVEVVERIDIGAFHVSRTGSGKAQCPPRMRLALLIYAYASGIFSSRRIEQAMYRNVSVRFITAARHHFLRLERQPNLTGPDSSPMRRPVRAMPRHRPLASGHDREAAERRGKTDIPKTKMHCGTGLRHHKIHPRLPPIHPQGYFAKVKTEWTLVTLAYNCKRLCKPAAA